MRFFDPAYRQAGFVTILSRILAMSTPYYNK